MTIKATLLSLIILFSTSIFGHTKNSKFIILGQVQGYSNGAIIYLNDVSEGSYKKIDSAKITGNKFRFTGFLKGKYLKASITSFDYTDRATLWIEKGLTSFKAEKGNFTRAKIVGSSIQSKWNENTLLQETAINAVQTEYQFIKSNPNSIISAHNLSSNLKTWSIDTVSTLYKQFSKEIKQSSYGKKIYRFISLNRDIKIGDKFVDFSQKDTAHKIVKLSDFTGKIVLLEFWGSWCGPCREENPALLKIYNEFKPKGFEILGVAAEDDEAKWIKAINQDGLNWTNISDLKGGDNQAALIYGVTGYPMNFLIDKNGIIIAKEIYGENLRKVLLKNL